MPELTVNTPDGPIGGVLEHPAGNGRHPGVVVVHDALGLSADIRGITRDIADHGYLDAPSVVVAPVGAAAAEPPAG